MNCGVIGGFIVQFACLTRRRWCAPLLRFKGPRGIRRGKWRPPVCDPGPRQPTGSATDAGPSASGAPTQGFSPIYPALPQPSSPNEVPPRSFDIQKNIITFLVYLIRCCGLCVLWISYLAQFFVECIVPLPSPPIAQKWGAGLGPLHFPITSPHIPSQWNSCNWTMIVRKSQENVVRF